MIERSALVVVGGGPAGMAAAIEAARAGLPCTLIDEAPRLGGQIYRQIPAAFGLRDSSVLGPDYLRGEALRAELQEQRERVAILSSTVVLGLSQDKEVMWASDENAGNIRADCLILATGAYERPVPFPGWTLPGVMAAGGVQRLVKTLQIRPGRRAIVAGTGPLILGVAHRLLEIGIEVTAVLDAGTVAWLDEAPAEEKCAWDEVEAARRHLRHLRRAGVPLLASHTIFAAHGREQVESVTYGPVDPIDWRPVKQEARSADADLLCIGFGFFPNTELTMLAGCRHGYSEALGGWIPARNALMETTVPGIFAAGDGAGIKGALASTEEGRIAGITAAERAGALSAKEAAKRRTAHLDRLHSLLQCRAAIDKASRIRPGLSELIEPETIMCRCEEVSRAEVEAAIEQGARDLQAVKLLTRLGMGSCQARNCAPATHSLLCRATGRPPAEVGQINPRPPVRPVTLGVLAQITAAEAPQGSK